MMILNLTTTSAVATLGAELPGVVHLPGTAAYDSGRMPWNVAVDQRPAAVAVPTSADQVAVVVRRCSELGLRVAPQSTGHSAGGLLQHDLDDVVLLRLTALRGVTVDPATATARVQGGALWDDVVAAAVPHGLTALHGSSPDVAVAGYALGGGIGWFARKHGLASSSVTAVEVATADGRLVRADASQETELFWGVRGGGGSFGVVTALELALLPIADAYAGMMLWDIGAAERVVRAWSRWSVTAPEEATTSLRVMRFPPIPELPPFLSGRAVVIVDGVVLGDDEHGEAVLASLRDLDPELDTFSRTPARALTRLHLDPEGPTPGVGGSLVLGSFTDPTVDAFLAAVGPDAQTPLLAAELRHLGGALSRPAARGGALDRLDGSHVAFFLALAATPAMAAAGSAAVADVEAALSGWANGRSYLNFTDGPVEVSTAYPAETWERLRALKSRIDPHGLFLANHPVPAA